MPIAPAAHYHMGGVLVDENGKSGLQGLWACGEVASTGVHGANRLASNSLLEAVVFGRRVAHDIASLPRTDADSREPAPPATSSAVEPIGVRARLRQLMWTDVGLLRTRDGLERALSEIAALRKEAPEAGSELHNLLTIAPLVATAALARTESRGSHVRLDHPKLDPAWQSRQLRRLVIP